MLNTAFVTRPVNTHIFAPFLVARLEEHPAVRDRALLYEVTIENLGETGKRSLPLMLAWTEAMVPPIPLAAQLEYITEAAACGLALAALSHLTAAVLVDVADRGDRYDYIVEVNGVQCGLEISGSQTLEKRVLRERHEQKIEQLLDNPQHWGGFVAIVGFMRREIILSYHDAGEAT